MQEVENTPAEQEQVLGEGSQEESPLPDNPEAPSSVDPLDAIEDPVALRGEAKKFRAIAGRKSKPEAPKAEEAPAPVQPSAEPLTARDLYRINSQKAVKLAKSDPAFEGVDFEAVRALYTNRRGQEDPDLILEDLKDALVVHKARNPAASQGDAGAELQTTTGKRQSGAPAPTGERQTQPILRKSSSMKDWYTPKTS
jgi:hypothetical protein